MFKNKMIFILGWLLLVSCAVDLVSTNPNNFESIVEFEPKVIYDKTNLNVVYGTAASALVEEIVLQRGQEIFNYELTNSLPTSEITFNPRNGSISISDSLEVGSYGLGILAHITNAQTTTDNQIAYYSYNITVAPYPITDLNSVASGTAFRITNSYFTAGLATDIANSLLLNGKSLIFDKDYTLELRNATQDVVDKFSFTRGDLTINGNVPAGTYTVALIGEGNFRGEITTNFEVSLVEQSLTAFEYVRYETNRGGNHFYADHLSVSLGGNDIGLTSGNLTTTATTLWSGLGSILGSSADSRDFIAPNSNDPQDFRVDFSNPIIVSDLAANDLVIRLTKSSSGSTALGSSRLKGGYFRFYFTDPSLNVSTSGANVADLSNSNTTIVATLSGGDTITLSEE